MPRIEVIYPISGTIQHQNVTIERMQQYLRYTFYINALESVASKRDVDPAELIDEIPFADQDVDELADACLDYFDRPQRGPVESSLSLTYFKDVIADCLPTVDFQIFNTDRAARRFGLCYSFSLVRSAMERMQAGDWWQEVLLKINAWDAKYPERLAEPVRLESRPEAVTSLNKLFDTVINFLAYNFTSKNKMGNALSNEDNYDCVKFLKPGSPFYYLYGDAVHRIQSYDCYVQYFTVGELSDFLQSNVGVFTTAINLLESHRHACTIDYDLTPGCSSPWMFSDPNYNDGKWHRFSTAREMAVEIIARPSMGNALVFHVMSTTSTTIALVKPDLPIDNLYKRFYRQACLLLLQHEPVVFKQLWDTVSLRVADVGHLGDALALTNHAGWTAVYLLVQFHKEVFVDMLNLARADTVAGRGLVLGTKQALLIPIKSNGDTPLKVLMESIDPSAVENILWLAAEHDSEEHVLKKALVELLPDYFSKHWSVTQRMLRAEDTLRHCLTILSADIPGMQPLRQQFIKQLTFRAKVRSVKCSLIFGRQSVSQIYTHSVVSWVKAQHSVAMVESLRAFINEVPSWGGGFDAFTSKYYMLHCSRFTFSPLRRALESDKPRKRVASLPELVNFLHWTGPRFAKQAYLVLHTMFKEKAMPREPLEYLPRFRLPATTAPTVLSPPGPSGESREVLEHKIAVLERQILEEGADKMLPSHCL
ncbi:MAG: hypothetical protein P1U63_02025 [Coxiellaceae bacterium]|nr:hypothetical protein [Coxiellaceae bacterium]